MKQPDLYYFKTMQMTSQAWSKFTENTCLWLIFSIQNLTRLVTALICMSLMGCSAWWTIGPRGYLKSCNFFHWLHCTPKLKDTAFSIAVYNQDRLEMKQGPSKPFFHSYLIAKGTKKRDAPSAARKGGRMSSCNTKSGIRTGTKQDKPTRTSTKIK